MNSWTSDFLNSGTENHFQRHKIGAAKGTPTLKGRTWQGSQLRNASRILLVFIGAGSRIFHRMKNKRLKNENTGKAKECQGDRFIHVCSVSIRDSKAQGVLDPGSSAKAVVMPMGHLGAALQLLSRQPQPLSEAREGKQAVLQIHMKLNWTGSLLTSISHGTCLSLCHYV